MLRIFLRVLWCFVCSFWRLIFQAREDRAWSLLAVKDRRDRSTLSLRSNRVVMADVWSSSQG